jgi:hypothetical protein
MLVLIPLTAYLLASFPCLDCEVLERLAEVKNEPRLIWYTNDVEFISARS